MATGMIEEVPLMCTARSAISPDYRQPELTLAPSDAAALRTCRNAQRHRRCLMTGSRNDALRSVAANAVKELSTVTNGLRYVADDDIVRRAATHKSSFLTERSETSGTSRHPKSGCAAAKPEELQSAIPARGCCIQRSRVPSRRDEHWMSKDAVLFARGLNGLEKRN
jgi:hypothetical protein